MLEKFLRDIGLNDKELAIYLELLKLENCSVLDLSKKTKILRTTIYPILNDLEQKGLISRVQVGKKINFQAEAPEKLNTFIETQKLKLAEQSKLASEYIPQLKSLSRQTGEKPVIKVYDGREGIIKANEESFGYDKENPNDISYFIYPFDLLEKFFSGSEIQKARGVRLTKHIKSKSLYTYSKGERGSDEYSRRIRIDGAKYPVKCDISIYRDRVRIHTLGKSLSSVLIKSQDIADTLKSLFELIFDHLDKKSKK